MLDAAGLEIALELRAAGADLVRALERLHPLEEGTLGSRHGGLGGRLRGGRHGRRVYIDDAAGKAKAGEFSWTST